MKQEEEKGKAKKNEKDIKRGKEDGRERRGEESDYFHGICHRCSSEEMRDEGRKGKIGKTKETGKW